MNRSSSKTFIALILFLVALSPTAAAVHKPLTLLDYYLLMPQAYLRYAGGDSAEGRQSAIYVRDVEHNYLQVRQPSGEFYTALALFKDEDGGDLIAVENRDCARGCTEEFFLLRYQDEQWKDVTGQSLPSIDERELRAKLSRQFNGNFQPQVLHQLSAGGKFIDVIEYWSGIALGQLEWTNGAFVFKPLAAQPSSVNRNALASVTNEAGDRLQIIGVAPQSPARLPIEGRLSVQVAYDIKSAAHARIFIAPVIDERLRRDDFNGGSTIYERGAGVTTKWLGFFNESRLSQLQITMVGEDKKELLRLNYNVDAAWEGTLECPALYVSCFTNRDNPGAPLSCQVNPSGVAPNQRLTYQWSISNGVIVSGQGTPRINFNSTSASTQGLTTTVRVGGLDAKCATASTTNIPAAAFNK